MELLFKVRGSNRIHQSKIQRRRRLKRKDLKIPMIKINLKRKHPLMISQNIQKSNISLLKRGIHRVIHLRVNLWRK